MNILLGTISAIVLAALSVMLDGWVLVKLWGWFVAQQFGLPLLSIPAAIGISLVVGYLTNQQAKRDSDSGMLVTFIQITTRPLFALAFGLVVKMFL